MNAVVLIISTLLWASGQIVVGSDTEHFFSKKVIKGHVPASNLFIGHFSTRQDHARPQQRELHLFVNYI